MNLDSMSTVEDVLSAAKEAGIDVPNVGREVFGERAYSGFDVVYTALDRDYIGVLDDVHDDVEAWTVTYDRFSWSRGTTVREGFTLIRHTVAGFDPDGFCDSELYEARAIAPEDVMACMQVVRHGCVPVRRS